MTRWSWRRRAHSLPQQNFVANEYDAWEDAHVEWPSIAAFAAAPAWIDGIHTISLGRGPAIDLLFRGSPLEDAVVPVFFNGAVTERESKAGPFFSGQRIAAAGGFGFIAVSDPSTNLHESLGLAWYAGHRHGSLQDELTEILAVIARRSGRELLLVGGSGGGFAALHYGHRLGESASVLVWNPQTDVLSYNPAFVRNYLQHAYDLELPERDWEPVARKAFPGALTVLGSRPRRLLYTQNSTDWHIERHTRPFLDGYVHQGHGRFEADPQHVVLVATYGQGHAALPERLVSAAIGTLRDPSASAREAAERLTGLGQGLAVPDEVSPALAQLLGDDRTVPVLTP